ncbi:MAG: ATP-dependent DNA helicase [Desulfurococcales archaeon]|nr:ATP-dependent DNA helicase [Desulfurococcales archaeon]
MSEPLFPYTGFRKGQREVALLVKEAVENGTVLSVRAPTGFGKTASIIYGLLLAGAEKVLYLVRTVNELYPVVRELRRFRQPFTLLFSARRSCPLMSLEGKPPPQEDFWDNCRLARLRGLCRYFSNVDKVAVEAVMDMISRSSEPPLMLARRIAREFDSCPFFTLRRLVDSSRFIVATYPYLFRADIFQGVLEPYDYSDFIVVVDEAHTLATVNNLLEQRLKASTIEKSIEEVKKYLPEARLVVQELQGLLMALKRLKPKKLEKPRRIDKEEILGEELDLSVILDAAEEIRDKKLEEALLSGGNVLLGRVRTWISRVASWLSILVLPESRLFVEPGEEEPEYVTLPMDPAVVVRTPLQNARAVILASGTLPKGDFVRELLGVERQVKYVDTDVAFGRFVRFDNIYTVVARDVTTRYRERSAYMYKRLSAYVAAIASGLSGLKLFVYPSYEVMKEVVSRLPVNLDVLVESRGTSIDEVEEWIRGSPEVSVHAVASGKLVEGVEFTDEYGRNLLHIVVLVGVPYPQPDDYSRTMEEDLEARIGRSRARYYVFDFQTIVRIKQALGRATRSPEDRAVYFLLDYRYLRKDLRVQLEVPVSRVVSSLSGLASAIAEARARLAVYSSSSRKDSNAS